MRVLFSAVGRRDPVDLLSRDRTSGEGDVFTEGSLLQAIRKVKPDIIYLYLTQEMAYLDEKDDRYVKSIMELYRHLDYKSEDEALKEVMIHKIMGQDEGRPHDFNLCIQELGSALNKIHEKHSEAELYVNISSGTPAIENALYLLASFSSYKMRVVQVDAPGFVGESNSNNEKKQKVDYDQELANLSILEANKEKLRAYYPPLENMNYTLKKRLMIGNINQFNYKAALTIARTVADFLDASVISLIKAADYKSTLDNTRKESALKGVKKSLRFSEYKKRGVRIVDYLLYLDLNLKRGLLLDFFRGLTPFIINVFELYLKRVLKIPLDSYTEERGRKGIRRCFSPEKLDRDDTGRKIHSLLTRGRTVKFNFGNSIASWHCLILIKGLSTDVDFIRKCQQLRDIEVAIRNPVAHRIVSLDENGVVHMMSEATRKSGKRTGEKLQRILWIYARKFLKHAVSTYRLMSGRHTKTSISISSVCCK